MQRLPKQFFKEHPLMQRSPAAIVYFRIESDADAKIEDTMKQILGQESYDRRMAQIAAEGETIEALTTSEALVSMLRKAFDPLNLPVLCKKAIAMGEDAFSAILHRYKTSFQDAYLEAAVFILAKADPAYTKQLLAQYADIRNPYAQSLACLLFGMQKLEEAVSLLMAEYEKMAKNKEDPMLCQGPLLGLYILNDQAE